MSQTLRSDSHWSKSGSGHKQPKLSPLANQIKQISSINNDLNSLENRFDKFEKTLRNLQENKQNIKKTKGTKDRDGQENKSSKFRIEKIGKLTNNSRKVKIENKIYTCRNFPASYFHNVQALAQNSERRNKLANKKKQKLKQTKETSRCGQNMKASQKNKFMVGKSQKLNAPHPQDQKTNRCNNYRDQYKKTSDENMIKQSKRITQVKDAQQLDNVKQQIDSSNNSIKKPAHILTYHHPQFVNAINENSKKLQQPQNYRLLQKIIHNDTVEVPSMTPQSNQLNLEEQFDCFLMRLTKRSNLNNSLNHNLKSELLQKGRESAKLKEINYVDKSMKKEIKYYQQQSSQNSLKKIVMPGQGAFNQLNQHRLLLVSKYEKEPSIVRNLLQQSSDQGKEKEEPQWKHNDNRIEKEPMVN